MKKTSYIFVGKPPFDATAYELTDREKEEYGKQAYYTGSTHLFDRIVRLCMMAGYPRFTQAELDMRQLATTGPRIELRV